MSEDWEARFTEFVTAARIESVEYHPACMILRSSAGALTYWFGDRDYPTKVEIERKAAA
jgi:hypothetical protein